MINRLSLVLTCGAFAALLGACGGGGGLSPSEAINDSYSKACSKFFECMDSFPGTADQFTQTFGASEAECVTQEAQAAADNGQSPDDYQAAIDGGTIVFNADDAQVCLDSFDAISCDDLWAGTAEQAPECDTAFEGQVASGDACSLDDECSVDGDSCQSDNVCGAG